MQRSDPSNNQPTNYMTQDTENQNAEDSTAAACSRHWRSSAFWHSDIEDAVDRTVSDGDHYNPQSRPDFLRAVANELRQAAADMEAENGENAATRSVEQP